MMAELSKHTVQKLAVLHVLSLWSDGDCESPRLQHALYLADRESADQEWRLFTFKRWQFGQYSDEIAAALNDLQSARRIRLRFNGPSQRIEAQLSSRARTLIRQFCVRYFPDWHFALGKTLTKGTALNRHQITSSAQSELNNKRAAHGQVISRSQLPAQIDFVDLTASTAESLSDFVDPRFIDQLRGRLRKAAGRPIKTDDWRMRYFSEEPAAC